METDEVPRCLIHLNSAPAAERYKVGSGHDIVSCHKLEHPRGLILLVLDNLDLVKQASC